MNLQRRVVLEKKPGAGFGMNIVGPTLPGDPLGIYVSLVKPGASADGKVNVGDNIISANGQPLSKLMHQEATQVLRNAEKLELELVNDPIGSTITCILF